MTRLLPLFAVAALLSGCGGKNNETGAGSTPPAPGNVAISGAEFGAWSSAAKGAAGIDCVTPQFVYSDTGEAIRSEGDAKKITSKREPAFQCANGLPFFWATIRRDAKAAKTDSDAAKVAEGFSGVKVVDAPASAPDGATCASYTKETRFTCYLAYENLALMSNSMKSLDDAGAILAGGLEIVKKATS